MSTIAKDKGGSDFKPIPTGNQHAVCYAVYDIGTQPSYNPKFRDKPQVIIVWELPHQRGDFEKDGVKKNLPRAISQTFTLSLGDKSNLRPFLVAWRGKDFTPEQLKGFDVRNVVGANALLNITHTTKNGKTYADVSSISPLMAGMPKMNAENPLVRFSLDEHPKGQALPDSIPEWIRTRIMQSREWAENHSATDPNDAQNPAFKKDGEQQVDETVPF